ncbi:hypothetical protein P280DRAFT_481995 [Massarina eburnea CBS 473.64]|uniref:Uncharacterized protein n=1 Tax=Massarina eburnea CBS 473.64 TaxID=1395130 RepID=A0A6A6RW50_9PLEO|nr:hypothetical protein P280DRAFT_481995 [Massarina eburnea CBS 473.64]
MSAPHRTQSPAPVTAAAMKPSPPRAFPELLSSLTKRVGSCSAVRAHFACIIQPFSFLRPLNSTRTGFTLLVSSASKVFPCPSNLSTKHQRQQTTCQPPREAGAMSWVPPATPQRTAGAQQFERPAAPQQTATTLASSTLAAAQANNGAVATPQPTPEPATATAVPAQPATPQATAAPARVNQFARTPRTGGQFPACKEYCCTEDLNNYATITIHTAKCSACDRRNMTSFMLRCKGCGWQICHPCQEAREKKNTLTVAHGKVGATPRSSFGRPLPPSISTAPIPMKALTPAKKMVDILETSKEEEDTKDKNGKIDQPKEVPQEVSPPTSGEKRKRRQTPRAAKNKKRIIEATSEEELTDPPESPIKLTKGQRTVRNPTPAGNPASSMLLSGPRSRPSATQQQPSERLTTSPTPRNTGSIQTSGWSYTEDNARKLLGNELMNQMSGYTAGGHILGRQMPHVNPSVCIIPSIVARNFVPLRLGSKFLCKAQDSVRADWAKRGFMAVTFTTPEPVVVLRTFVLTNVQARYPKVELNDEARGALFGVVRSRFRALRRPNTDLLDLKMSELTDMQQKELDRMLSEDIADILNL